VTSLLLDTTFLVDVERCTGRVVVTADAGAFADLPEVRVRPR